MGKEKKGNDRRSGRARAEIQLVFFETPTRFNIVAISCIQLPPYSAGSRHITRNFHPLLCGLPRTVSAKTTPIKVDDLNRRAYGPG